MGYKCTFMDSEVYKAEDVNGIFAKLTSAGVVLADSGNVLADLNGAVSEIASAGVQDFNDSCRVTLADGVYKIGEGVCFMADGAAVTFDAAGYEITPISGAKSYVYLSRNAALNTIDVVVSETAGGAESVPIAEIDENGVIRDTRTYSKAKIRMTTESSLKSYIFTLMIAKGRKITADLGTGNFSKIILNEAYLIQSGVKSDAPLVAGLHNAEDIAEGGSVTFGLSANAGNSTYATVKFTKNGQNLEIETSETNRQNGWEYHFDVI